MFVVKITSLHIGKLLGSSLYIEIFVIKLAVRYLCGGLLYIVGLEMPEFVFSGN